MIRKAAASKKVRRNGASVPQRILLRVTIRHIEPPVWREISVPDDFTLMQLHRTLQMVFSWLDYHLFEFHVGTRRFEAAHAEAEGEDAAGLRLRDLELRRGSSLLYIYDFGDFWEHDIVVRNIEVIMPTDPTRSFVYVTDGARAAPPEDAGGPDGYDRILAIFAGQADGEDTEDVRGWLGPNFDPELFDRRAVDHALILASAWRVI
jgi:hypothetical protein